MRTARLLLIAFGTIALFTSILDAEYTVEIQGLDYYEPGWVNAPCHVPMVVYNSGGDSTIAVPASVVVNGWEITFMGAADGGAFSTVYDSENVGVPGPAGTTVPQNMKITIRSVGEAINIPAGYEVRYKDGLVWKSIYLPEITP